MFRVLRKDKQWNTLNKKKRETGTYPCGGGAMLLFVPPLTHSTWDHQIMGMGYDAGRNRKNEILLFTAGKRGGVLWDLGLTNVLRHRRLPRRKGEQARSASEARRAPEGRRRAEHEAEKPVELFWELARAVTQAVVADFFVDEADESRVSSRKAGTWWRWTGRRGGFGRLEGILSRGGWVDICLKPAVRRC